MATYAELNAILTDSIQGAQALREKVEIAGLIAAGLVMTGADTAAPFDQATTPYDAHERRVIWAQKMIGSPEPTGRQLFALVIAANAAVAQAGILGAADTAIQTAVNNVIDALATPTPIAGA